jgi:hypothetical protein
MAGKRAAANGLACEAWDTVYAPTATHANVRNGNGPPLFSLLLASTQAQRSLVLCPYPARVQLLPPPLSRGGSCRSGDQGGRYHLKSHPPPSMEEDGSFAASAPTTVLRPSSSRLWLAPKTLPTPAPCRTQPRLSAAPTGKQHRQHCWRESTRSASLSISDLRWKISHFSLSHM